MGQPEKFHRPAEAPNADYELLASGEKSAEQPVVEILPRIAKVPEEKGKVNPWVHFFAGGVAGMAGALFTSPLDVVKTRLQSSLNYDYNKIKRPQHASIVKRGYWHVADTFGIINSIYKNEGFTALFRGLGPNLAGAVPARSVNFFTYGLTKDFLSTKVTSESYKDSTFVHLASGVAAGVVTSTVTNPIWLVKTRLQLEKEKGGKLPYKNSFDCARKIVKYEGFKALYRGLSASYLGTVESSLQWMLYEQMKLFIARTEKRRLEQGHKLNSTDKFLNWSATSGAAGAAKFLASLLTYPHEVVRTRLRQAPSENGQPKYKGLIHCFKLVIKEEGFASMYGGLTPHLLRTVPNSIIMFGTWDLIVRLVASANSK